MICRHMDATLDNHIIGIKSYLSFISCYLDYFSLLTSISNITMNIFIIYVCCVHLIPERFIDVREINQMKGMISSMNTKDLVTSSLWIIKMKLSVPFLVSSWWLRNCFIV